MSTSKIETWIKAGYALLGTEGLESLKIERIARGLNLNKSGFYYYFESMPGFLKRLLEYHVELANVVAADIERCETMDPDLVLVIVRQKSFFLVESQLLVKSRLAHTHLDVDQAGKIITKALMTLWRNQNPAFCDQAVASAHLNIIRHFIYARIDAENITYEFIHDLVAETRMAFEKITTDPHA